MKSLLLALSLALLPSIAAAAPQDDGPILILKVGPRLYFLENESVTNPSPCSPADILLPTSTQALKELEKQLSLLGEADAMRCSKATTFPGVPGSCLVFKLSKCAQIPTP